MLLILFCQHKSAQPQFFPQLDALEAFDALDAFEALDAFDAFFPQSDARF